MKPKVSIVMNSYQEKSSWLNAAITACFKQESVEVQLIVSTVRGDRAVEIAKQRGVEFITCKHPGIYHQLNNALQLVRGDWFCCVSGNDVLMPRKCIDEIRLCVNGRKVCYSAFYVADGALVVTDTSMSCPYTYRKHLGRNFVYDDAIMSREILEKYKPFREEFGNDAYWDFWLRVAEGEGNVFAHNSVPELVYRQTAVSRHCRKRVSPRLRAQDHSDRRKMLAAHGVRA